MLSPLHLLPVAFLAVATTTAPIVAEGAETADGCPATFCHLPRWSEAGASPNAEVGRDVALLGDTAFVAAPGEDAVYVYTRLQGDWSFTQLLEPTLPGGGQRFGDALSADGDRVAIAAPYATVGGDVEAGTVYVFARSGATWTFEQRFDDPTPSPEEHFGTALDLVGDRLAISSPEPPTGGTGSVVIHDLQAGGWVHNATLSGFAHPIYRDAVAIDGARVVVGRSTGWKDGVQSGRMHVWRETVAGWLGPVEIEPIGGYVDGDGFGHAADAHDGFLAVSAVWKGTAGIDAGAVFTYRWSDQTQTYEPISTLLPCGGGHVGSFGEDVSVRDGRIAVGEDGNGAGRVHVYEHQVILALELWKLLDVLAPSDGAALDRLGHGVALGEGVVLAGAPGVDVNGGSVGAAYLFGFENDLAGGPCPCDALGGWETYGTGKAGSVGVPALGLSQSPVLGQTTDVVLSNALVGAPALVVYGTTPGVIPFDGGALLVADPRVIELGPVGLGGELSATWQLPVDAAFCGAEVVAQAFVLDPGASGAYSTAQSAGLRVYVGY